MKTKLKGIKFFLLLLCLIIAVRLTSCVYILPSTKDFNDYRNGFTYLNCEIFPFAKKYQYGQPYFMENTKYLKVKGVPKEKFVVAKNTEYIGFMEPAGGTSYKLLYAPDIKLSDFTIKSIQFYAVVSGYKPESNYKLGVREISCETADSELFEKFWQTYNGKTEFIEPVTDRKDESSGYSGNFGYDENGKGVLLSIRLTFEEYKNIVWDIWLFRYVESYGLYVYHDEYWYFLDSSFNPYIEEAIAKIEQGEYNK